MTQNEQAVQQQDAGGQDRKWYVVHTLSGQEYKVKERLESRIKSHEMEGLIFQVLISSEKVAEVKAGKKTISARKFFPGYLLLQVDMNNETWHLVRNTPRVTGFIGGKTKPIPIPDDGVDEGIDDERDHHCQADEVGG